MQHHIPSFYGEHLGFDLTPRLMHLHHILIFHGADDDVVPVSSARQIHDGAQAPKELIIMAKGDHPISDPTDQERFMRETTAWFTRWLLAPV